MWGQGSELSTSKEGVDDLTIELISCSHSTSDRVLVSGKCGEVGRGCQHMWGRS